MKKLMLTALVAACGWAAPAAMADRVVYIDNDNDRIVTHRRVMTHRWVPSPAHNTSEIRIYREEPVGVYHSDWHYDDVDDDGLIVRDRDEPRGLLGAPVRIVRRVIGD
jgi:hypothetical protein